jgi:hypothetical protein
MAAEDTLLADIPPGHGVLSKMTSDDGDFRIPWDPADEDATENARQMFDDLRRDGYMIYQVGERRRGREPQRTQVRTFDPQAGQLVAVRPNQGG